METFTACLQYIKMEYWDILDGMKVVKVQKIKENALWMYEVKKEEK